MDRLSENKIILVKRKSRLEDLITRYNSISQAKFYIEHMGSDFSDYVMEHETYKRSVLKAETELSALGMVQTVDREFIPNFIFGKNDIVVVVGQDGLVANTLKYLSTQLCIGVNPDPARWDGVLLPFQAGDLKLLLPEVFKNKRPVKEVTMAKATLNDGQSMYAVNGLFIGQKTHVSSRYIISSGEHKEYQSSSGVIVSTGLGSTGWFKSIIAGAMKIATGITEKGHIELQQQKIGWNADFLYFSVREPFPSKMSKTDIVFGKVTKSCPLKLLSQMPENGVIFSDGVESDFLHFNSGIEATISIADKIGHLVV